MPLSRREFEARIGDFNSKAMKAIYDFLAVHRDLAYSRVELKRVVEQLRSPELRTRFPDALETLVAVGAIEKRFVRAQGEGEEDYYAFAQEMDTTKWKPLVVRF